MFDQTYFHRVCFRAEIAFSNQFQNSGNLDSTHNPTPPNPCPRAAGWVMAMHTCGTATAEEACSRVRARVYARVCVNQVTAAVPVPT